MVEIALMVNGKRVQADCEPRLLLSDFLRHQLGLTGTHVGCEQGVCGACTILINGASARSCITLAVQVDGDEITTIEGLSSGKEDLTEVQRALGEAFGLQCGFCTPGVVMSLTAALNSDSVDSEILKEVLGGHICRCTGYQGMWIAAEAVVQSRRVGAP
jgi:aerobic-type carbon monoxide dehydrogenase small subunit (CoxS/CutS family)